MEIEIKRTMNWMNLSNDVKEFVKTCPHCQLFRRDINDKPEYQSRRLPQYPMQRISMDFLSLESSTRTGSHKVLVIVDELTRYAEAIVVPNEQGETAANVLMTNIICRYGVPEELITDQGSAFISDLFENLCYQLGIDKIFTTAYHPQGNGVNERMHATLYNILRSLTGRNPYEWKKQLPYALFIYRTSYHKAINMSPHKALYGYQPKHIALEQLPTDDYFPLDERVKTMVQMHERCKQYLQTQQERRNNRLNQAKETPQYEPGDWVKLRIHERANKLSPFWKGPYQIMRKVNNVNYEVDFPQYQNQSRIIHVQHIKPWRGLPNNENEEIPSPGSYKEKITKKEKKMDQVQNRPITRAYAKLLKQLDQSRQDLKPVACLYDEANDTIIEYLRQDQLQPEGITVADDSS
jgi:transposase InsO family protein